MKSAASSNGGKPKGKATKQPKPPPRPQQEVEGWALSAYGRKRDVKGRKY